MKLLEEMLSKLGLREQTMRTVIKELGTNQIIVETGCIRQLDNWIGDGQSTRIWQEVGQVYSVDIDPEAVATATTVLKYPHAEVFCQDSIEFLWSWSQPIKLLYLDSVDFDLKNPLLSATHHMAELAAAIKNLQSGSIVMVDDTGLSPGGVIGKGMLISPFMDKIGAKTICSGPWQMAWKLV